MKKPRALILHAAGTNRDLDVARAVEQAGGEPRIVHINALAAGEHDLLDHRFLILPGGFSFGDDLGAGQLLAVLLRHRLREPLARFIEAGRPVLGICNGFQALVKAGLLPGPLTADAAAEPFAPRRATLTHNSSGRFECRWVWLAPDPASPCIFTRDLDAPIFCPVAHGEGRFVARDAATLSHLEQHRMIPLRYANPGATQVTYPQNPNGSAAHIAGLCNAAGNVMGLMPHPEDHTVHAQHPRVHRGERGGLGLALFERAIAHARLLD